MTDLLTRRGLLVALGAAAGVLALPPELAWAAKRRPRATRVIVLNLSGGVRSSAAFIASGQKQLNPWGRMRDVPLPLGNVLELGEPERSIYLPGPTQPIPRRYRTREAEPRVDVIRMPRLRDIANAFSVVGTWDPERGDHLRSERVAHTGASNEQSTGLLVRIFGALGESERGSAPGLPAFELGEPGSASFAPRGKEAGTTVSVLGPASLPRRDEGETDASRRTGAGFRPRVSGRDRLDQKFLDAMGPAGRTAVRGFTQQRRLTERLSIELADPVVRWTGGWDGAAARGELRLGSASIPLTNDLLAQILAVPGPYAGFGGSDAAQNLMLAFRLLQLGSPAVSVTVPGFDMHSGELEQAPGIYGGLGRMWAALHFLLQHVPDPTSPGASMLDRTLVVTNSEFGRDPGLANTGFNGGGGSDHGSHPATFYLGHAVMGAGVVGGRVLGGVNTDSYDATRSRERHAPSDLLATILLALGLDADDERWGFPEARPIAGLWRAT
jgi:uncharacterized protein (DUF1501 family)